MKNPHGVEPTRFMNRKGSEYAIKCVPLCGPLFGNKEILINDNCNKEDSCYIYNNGEHEYECHPQYKISLFVNTAGPDERNNFTVLDYEVYTHN